MAKDFPVVSTALIVLFTGLAGSAIGQPPVPIAEAPATLWRFLGVPQTLTGGYDALANRRGNRPGLERRGRAGRVRRIADPAFLDPEAPPLLKTAAQIKVQEDLAPQKVKALKYLGSIGCGCYDKDGEVTAAMLAGLNDCTEEVRMAAVEVITEGACSEYCEFCRQRSCCKPELAKKLDNLANGQDENGCWLEPSERVRAAAARALAACGPIVVESRPLQQQQEDRGEDLPPVPPESIDQARRATPLDTASQQDSPRATLRPAPVQSSRREPAPSAAFIPRIGAEHPTIAGATPGRAASPRSRNAPGTSSADGSADLYGLFQAERSGATMLVSNVEPAFDAPALASTSVDPAPLVPVPQAQPSGHPASAQTRGNNTREGVIEDVDEANGIALVRFEHVGQVDAGTPVSIVHRTLVGEIHVSGRVDRCRSGYAIVRPFKSELIGRIARGDEATLYIPQPVRIPR